MKGNVNPLPRQLKNISRGDDDVPEAIATI